MATKFGLNKSAYAKIGKKKKDDRLAEITFDRDARKEYLTGFHKRKLERIKKAQEAAVQREKEERLRDRKEVCTTLSKCKGGRGQGGAGGEGTGLRGLRLGGCFGGVYSTETVAS